MNEKRYPLPFPKGTDYDEGKPPEDCSLAHESSIATRYAKDLIVKLGTRVLAIDHGTVVDMKNDSDKYLNPVTHPRYRILFEENRKISTNEKIKLIEELFEFSERYTNFLKIRHNDETVSEYFHLGKDIQVKLKQKVREGDLLGYVGMTGVTSKSHLHLNVFESISIPFCLKER